MQQFMEWHFTADFCIFDKKMNMPELLEKLNKTYFRDIDPD